MEYTQDLSLTAAPEIFKYKWIWLVEMVSEICCKVQKCRCGWCFWRWLWFLPSHVFCGVTLMVLLLWRWGRWGSVSPLKSLQAWHPLGTNRMWWLTCEAGQWKWVHPAWLTGAWKPEPHAVSKAQPCREATGGATVRSSGLQASPAQVPDLWVNKPSGDSSPGLWALPAETHVMQQPASTASSERPSCMPGSVEPAYGCCSRHHLTATTWETQWNLSWIPDS